MAYTVSKGMVTENAPLLEHIYKCVKQGRSAVFKTKPHLLAKNNYRMHNLLKAAQILTDEAGGKYAGLRESCTVKMDGRRSAIVIEPKDTSTLGESLIPDRPDENDALAIVKGYQGKETMLKFWPSDDFNFPRFQMQIEEAGFELATKPDTGEVIRMEGEEDEVMYLARRVKKKKPSVLEQFGFAKGEVDS